MSTHGVDTLPCHVAVLKQQIANAICASVFCDEFLESVENSVSSMQKHAEEELWVKNWVTYLDSSRDKYWTLIFEEALRPSMQWSISRLEFRGDRLLRTYLAMSPETSRLEFEASPKKYE